MVITHTNCSQNTTLRPPERKKFFCGEFHHQPVESVIQHSVVYASRGASISHLLEQQAGKNCGGSTDI